MGFFVKREDNTIDMSDVLYSSSINLLVRYCNLPDSIEWSRLYGSIEEYNGDKLGIVNGTFYDTLSEKYFSLDDENEKEKLQIAAWEYAAKKIDTILNQIIEAMGKED